VLSSVEALPGAEFREETGSTLSNMGIDGVKKIIEDIKTAGGGCFFIDEAYQLADSRNVGGSMVLEYLLAEIENNRGVIVFIFAGYRKEMEKFFEHNPGIPRRIPHTLSFTDYEDEELLEIFTRVIYKKYGGRMKLEDGPKGLYRGFVISVIGIIAYRASYFGMFDTGKAFLFPDAKKANFFVMWGFA